MDLDTAFFELQTIFTGQELVHAVTLVTLELNHLAVLRVFDNGAIAGYVGKG